MANKLVKLLINSADFPLPYSTATRTVVQSDDAAPRMPQAFFGDRTNAEFGSPQLLFGENFVPTAKGVQSVGYGQQAAPFSGAVTTFDQAIVLRDTTENQRVFAPAGGANYVLNFSTGVWTSINPFVATPGLITRAYVAGRTFVCYQNQRIIELNAAGTVFTTIALTYPAGLGIANVRGIAGVSNYLVVFTDVTLYWCSPLNILDFSQPDAGAGNQIPIDIKGFITAVLPTAGGFVIYTTRNAIAATYTNNSNSPFVFKEINNVGGVTSWEQVTPEADESGHYAWTRAGLQLVTLGKAVSIFPAVTDYLVGGRFSSYDELEHTVTTVDDVVFNIKMAFLCERYLIISYGVNSTKLSHALLYDTTLQRWGHLKLDHVDAFSYPYPSISLTPYNYDEWAGSYLDYAGVDYASIGSSGLSVPRSKQGLAFLQNDGTIYVLDMSAVQSAGVGVVVFGHLQQRHSNFTTLLGVEVEGLQYTDTATDYAALTGSYAFYGIFDYAELGTDLAEAISVQPSDTGADREEATPLAVTLAEKNYIRCDSRITARNFDITITGNFALSSLLAEVMLHGIR